jgi:pimeloyl-ACP methyl ester carboxylesterase
MKLFLLILIFLVACSSAQRELKLSYKLLGTGNKGIVLIHDIGATKEVWRDTASKLRPYGKVIALDLYGHGNSEKDISISEAVDNFPIGLKRVIRTEKLKSVVLVGVGNSSGFLIKYAQNNSKMLKALILIDVPLKETNKIKLVPEVISFYEIKTNEEKEDLDKLILKFLADENL